MLKADNLHKNFDEFKAVKGVSFEIGEGEIYSLLGPNGAGKTTTISMLTGLLSPTSGNAYLNGFSVREDVNRVKEIIGVVPQEIALYPTISARENLSFWGKMVGLKGKQLSERIDIALEISGLADRAKDQVETFSGGMKRRLNIAVGLLHEPKIIFMDEPTVGIDPQSRRRILDTVKSLNENGMAVLYTTHYMEEAEELSDRIGIIDHGKLIAQGTQEELTQMVGEFDTIKLNIGEIENIEERAKKLCKLPKIENAFGENGDLMLQARDANEVLSEVIEHLNNVKIKIHSLKIQEPNLEAVFLHLTGRALRD
ncbi:MAG: ABC transporter ATP-binding protein [Anaerolineae bacterium]|nr:ABC transporter ATP-binding protein [Anaerolineae bacterium]MBT7073578.1 ABC transporter ATP-binding protein [Anaerolineae bacterium]MBT7782126.1 ABC transporter ATP-binding protein [Anaerolineae bacterium]